MLVDEYRRACKEAKLRPLSHLETCFSCEPPEFLELNNACTNISGAHFELLIEEVLNRKAPSLATLKLAYSHLVHGDVQLLCSYLQIPSPWWISYLDLEGNQIGDAGVSELCLALQGSQTLSCLILNNVHMTDIGLQELSVLVETLPRLLRLEVRNCTQPAPAAFLALRDTLMQRMASEPVSSASTTDSNVFSGSAVQELLEALTKRHSVRLVDVRGCWLYDESVDTVLQLLRCCPQLSLAVNISMEAAVLCAHFVHSITEMQTRTLHLGNVLYRSKEPFALHTAEVRFDVTTSASPIRHLSATTPNGHAHSRECAAPSSASAAERRRKRLAQEATQVADQSVIRQQYAHTERLAVPVPHNVVSLKQLLTPVKKKSYQYLAPQPPVSITKPPAPALTCGDRMSDSVRTLEPQQYVKQHKLLTVKLSTLVRQHSMLSRAVDSLQESDLVLTNTRAYHVDLVNAMQQLANVEAQIEVTQAELDACVTDSMRNTRDRLQQKRLQLQSRVTGRYLDD
eukprot:TRINITY_DN1104_c0_g1_i1.p1 TRINITY_DN1104_c0_g1~~TRINITY_DN1104_c0_g1_i1.p1  ORF type:complete len:513 (-),score=123.87 TRINITY_DN1104_c0_g1_i1:904-2442(-)